jgi:putative transposase
LTLTPAKSLAPKTGANAKPDRTPGSNRDPLSPEERQQALDVLHEPRFLDRSPREIFFTLLEEGIYLASVSTLYRILAERQEVRERRNLRQHPRYQAPELLATAPNQVWSWDITKMRGPVPCSTYSLYTILDIFSRYITGWLLAPRESALLAQEMIEESVRKQGLQPGQVILHADRGAPMRALSFRQKLASLGIEPSYSRPHVSNDNPYSESQFKTMKYSCDYPDRFGSLEDAFAFLRSFVPWYNSQHHHSGIAYLTPESLHYGRANLVQAHRRETLQEAFRNYPKRFGGKPPTPPALPVAAWINPPKTSLPVENGGEGFL